jgi:hypothetical protein
MVKNVILSYLNIVLVDNGNGPHADRVYDTYFPTYDNFGSQKNSDPFDMDAKHLQIYFDNLQIIYNYDVILHNLKYSKHLKIQTIIEGTYIQVELKHGK